MPHFAHGSARLYYESFGEGPPIIATHGAAENHLYWRLPGVAARLAAAGFRVVLTDMRGHGRSAVEGEPKGYDVDTVAADIEALANHLELDRFHLLGHATGGMAALRFAMVGQMRLLSLIVANGASATLPETLAREPLSRSNAMARAFRGRPWSEILRGAREGAREDPFLNSMHLAVDPAVAFAWYEACARLGDPDAIADFVERFYDDPDPRDAHLRRIACRVLILTGEHDRIFREPSESMSRQMPNAQFQVLQGRGHMTAFEDPEATTRALLDFLVSVQPSTDFKARGE
jgi:pimeloyl-ACP methyl ester carboxylesterase